MTKIRFKYRFQNSIELSESFYNPGLLLWYKKDDGVHWQTRPQSNLLLSGKINGLL